MKLIKTIFLYIILSPFISVAAIILFIPLTIIWIRSKKDKKFINEYLRQKPDILLYFYESRKKTEKTITTRINEYMIKNQIIINKVGDINSYVNSNYPKLVAYEINRSGSGNPWLVFISGMEIKSISLSGIVGYIMERNTSDDDVADLINEKIKELKKL